MILNDFFNNNFAVLAYLYDQKTEDNVVKITQDEVAEYMGLSRVTINKIFVMFVEHGYIYKDNKHIGRYLLTELGCKIVEVIRCLNVESNMIKAKLMLDTKDIF